MAVWAYRCRSCDGSGRMWYVAADRVSEVAVTAPCVQVKVDGEWRCAVLMADSAVAIDSQLVRDFVPSSYDECPDCEAAATAAAPGAPMQAGATPVGTEQPDPQRGRVRRAARQTVNAAAIALGGIQFVVVLVRMDVLDSPGEAEMAIATLSPSFGDVPVVLLAQDEAGLPHYHGPEELLALLEGVPIERMPWRDYPVG